MTDEEVLKFIDDLKGIKLLNFCFCGGETLLRKELIYKAAKKLKEYGCQNIAMVSNGWLLDEDVAKNLKESGVTKLQISLDGVTKASHEKLRNKVGSYERATHAIELLVKNGFQVGISFVPTNFNISEVEELHSYLRKVGISESLRIQPIMIMGRASENQDNIEPTNQQYRDLVRRIRQINQKLEAPVIEWGDPIDHLIRFRKEKMLISMVQIRANGDIVADQYLPLVVGNLRKHSIIDYWNNGLNNIWESEVIQEIASSIMCVKDMDLEHNKYLDDSFKKDQIYYDLIDDSEFYKNYGKEINEYAS